MKESSSLQGIRNHLENNPIYHPRPSKTELEIF